MPSLNRTYYRYGYSAKKFLHRYGIFHLAVPPGDLSIPCSQTRPPEPGNSHPLSAHRQSPQHQHSQQ